MEENSSACYRVIKVLGDKGMGAVAAQDLSAGHSIIRELPFMMSINLPLSIYGTTRHNELNSRFCKLFSKSSAVIPDLQPCKPS